MPAVARDEGHRECPQREEHRDGVDDRQLETPLRPGTRSGDPDLLLVDEREDESGPDDPRRARGVDVLDPAVIACWRRPALVPVLTAVVVGVLTCVVLLEGVVAAVTVRVFEDGALVFGAGGLAVGVVGEVVFATGRPVEVVRFGSVPVTRIGVVGVIVTAVAP